MLYLMIPTTSLWNMTFICLYAHFFFGNIGEKFDCKSCLVFGRRNGNPRVFLLGETESDWTNGKDWMKDWVTADGLTWLTDGQTSNWFANGVTNCRTDGWLCFVFVVFWGKKSKWLVGWSKRLIVIVRCLRERRDNDYTGRPVLLLLLPYSNWTKLNFDFSSCWS